MWSSSEVSNFIIVGCGFESCHRFRSYYLEFTHVSSGGRFSKKEKGLCIGYILFLINKRKITKILFYQIVDDAT